MTTVKELEKDVPLQSGLDDVPLQSNIDEEILRRVKKGCKSSIEYLMRKYEGIVHKKANTYFLIGSDHDDVVQEGLIGLYKAICDYDQSKRSSFSSFAELCITRQIITSIKSATRQKHRPLNTYVSIYKSISDDNSERMLLDTLISFTEIDPQDLLIHREKYEQIKNALMKTLTKLEREVFCLYIQGCTYEEIANKLGRNEKSIDNALQRVKKKVEQLNEKEELFD